jgi:excinuclease ABC subunit C
MVVFTNGVSDRAEYRKFKTRIEQNDDFYNMNETIQRRFSPKNLQAWGIPDLVLIDGGKGQLEAALRARDQRQSSVPFIGLAKKQEQIVIHHTLSNVTLDKTKLAVLDGYTENSREFILVHLPHDSHVVKLLQRIRDESHRFAVSYHSVLKRKGQTASSLEAIPGIGPATRKKLLKTFGSLRALQTTVSEDDLAAVIVKQKAALLKKYI